MQKRSASSNEVVVDRRVGRPQEDTDAGFGTYACEQAVRCKVDHPIAVV